MALEDVMGEKFDKKEIYEFCTIRNLMVKLEVIRATAHMPDYVNAEARLMPVGCNRMDECKKKSVNCMVYIKGGTDPCPEAWDA